MIEILRNQSPVPNPASRPLPALIHLGQIEPATLVEPRVGSIRAAADNQAGQRRHVIPAAV